MAWKQVIQEYFTEMGRITTGFPQNQVQEVVDIFYEAWKNKRTVFTMGNGGSASTASHFACDLAKFTIVPEQPRFRVIGLNDNIPLVSAWTNDSGFNSIFSEQMEPWMQADDVLVGFSVHGGSGTGEAGAWAQNLVRAMAMAKERNARIVGFSGFDGGAMKEMADICLVIPVNTEPLGTPIVEAYQVVLHHLICLALKERIRVGEG